ncbi:helix-turn-helix domain-containing protein [Salipaludibacillus sp. HK11]|uniref:helix-turn-helix domain-containing protein n=1 Tax=Salipaludibacillus sp. HK11 TaxID=3394320 RepID=UPI0039FC63CE
MNNWKVRLKLKELLVEREISQKELALRTGIREATLSVIVRNTTDKINYKHIGTIMNELNIEDFNTIFELYEEYDSREGNFQGSHVAEKNE